MNAASPTRARALWYTGPGQVEMRDEPHPKPEFTRVAVRTLYSAISRGTERLVLSGSVGQSEWERMRAPFQAGTFPFPVKYGYGAVGVVEAGMPNLVGRTVFCLHPHQDRFVVPYDRVAAVPDGVPARRATLAANMETALNALWDAGVGPADRVAVVGGGIIGLLVAFVAARLPGADVTLVDAAPERAALATALGIGFTAPVAAPEDCDVVIHASASAAGLATAIGCAGLEATVVELSWYGDGTIPVPLGGAFHSRRLRLVSSQVGHVSPGRRPRWSYARRMEAALGLLADDRLDALVTNEIAFDDAPRLLPDILKPGAGGPAPVIRYT